MKTVTGIPGQLSQIQLQELGLCEHCKSVIHVTTAADKATENGSNIVRCPVCTNQIAKIIEREPISEQVQREFAEMLKPLNPT